MNQQAPRDGLIIVDKPEGITSHGVVARARKIVGTRKIGHAGTLDPMATGILVLGVGRATKLLGYLMGHDKTYAATIRFGQQTTTDDREGEVIAQYDATGLTGAQIRDALGALEGTITQVPSSVSAIKVDGRRAYDLVREGQQVELTGREVQVHEIAIGQIRRAAYVDVDVVVRCSSGTYIRAIARDAGAALGVGGHLISLRRTASGEFDESVAVSLDELAERAEPVVIGLDEAVQRSFAVRSVDAHEAQELSFGRALGPAGERDELFAAIDPDGHAVALVLGTGKPKVVFRPA